MEHWAKYVGLSEAIISVIRGTNGETFHLLADEGVMKDASLSTLQKKVDYTFYPSFII